MTLEEKERIRALEVRFDHMTETLEKMSGKVDELHELLLQAKGAKWVVLAVATGVGFVSGKVGALTGWMR